MGLKPRKWWAALVLPILLRALIPVGFMPIFGPGFSVRMVVCDGYALAPSTDAMPAAMSMDMPMDMPMGVDTRGSDSNGGGPLHHDGASCPYGSAPALGAPPTLALQAALLIRKSPERRAAAAQVAYLAVVPRAQSPRGPPA